MLGAPALVWQQQFQTMVLEDPARPPPEPARPPNDTDVAPYAFGGPGPAPQQAPQTFPLGSQSATAVDNGRFKWYGARTLTPLDALMERLSPELKARPGMPAEQLLLTEQEMMYPTNMPSVPLPASASAQRVATMDLRLIALQPKTSHAGVDLSTSVTCSRPGERVEHSGSRCCQASARTARTSAHANAHRTYCSRTPCK